MALDVSGRRPGKASDTILITHMARQVVFDCTCNFKQNGSHEVCGNEKTAKYALSEQRDQERSTTTGAMASGSTYRSDNQTPSRMPVWQRGLDPSATFETAVPMIQAYTWRSGIYNASTRPSWRGQPYNPPLVAVLMICNNAASGKKHSVTFRGNTVSSSE